MRRVFLIPRWAGKADGDFYLELGALVSRLGFPPLVPLMPKSGLNPPVLSECFALLDETGIKSDDVVIAHSVGNQVLLRWLAQRQGDPLSIQLISVAGWFTLDEGKVWPAIVPFLHDANWKTESLSSVHLLISDNDPFTSNWKGNIAHYNKVFGPEKVTTVVLPGLQHFNRSSEPELLQQIERVLRHSSSLWEPLCFGAGQPALAHRIALAPLTNCQSFEDGVLSDEEYHWLTLRSKGGFALTMTTASYVHPSGKGFPGQLGIFDDKHIPGLKRLVEGIHKEKSIAICQLHHGGTRAISGNNVGPIAEHGAASMTTEQVRDCVGWFVEAALRAEKAGFDGVVFISYILTSFLATSNTRADAYGGSFENRSRIVFEILRACRERCSKSFILGIRLSTERYGLDTNEITLLSKQLCGSGLIDFLDLSLWNVFKFPEDPALQYQGLMNHFLAIDRGNVKIGVTGQVIGGESAEQCLRLGADFVFVGRSAVLHHNFPNLVKQNKAFVRRLPATDKKLLEEEGVSPKFLEYLHKNFQESLFTPQQK